MCYWAEHGKAFASFLPLYTIALQTGSRICLVWLADDSRSAGTRAVSLCLSSCFLPFFISLFSFLPFCQSLIRKEHKMYSVEQSLICSSGQAVYCHCTRFIVKLMFNPWRIESVCCAVWTHAEQFQSVQFREGGFNSFFYSLWRNISGEILLKYVASWNENN